MRKFQSFMAAVLLATGPVDAEVYEMPPEGQDVIGSMSTITATWG